MFIAGRNFSLLITVITFLAVYLMPFINRRYPKLFVDMRRIEAMEHLREAISRAAEMGKKVLFTPGTSDIQGESQGPLVLAGLSVMGRVAEICAELDVPIFVTCRWPLVYQVSSSIVQDSFTRAGRPEAFDNDMVVLTSPDNFAWVNFTTQHILSEKPGAVFLMGAFRAHTITLAEAAVQARSFSIGGGGYDYYFALTMDYYTIGEELFAAGALASEDPVQKASIGAHDLVKSVVFAIIVLGLIASAVGNQIIMGLLKW